MTWRAHGPSNRPFSESILQLLSQHRYNTAVRVFFTNLGCKLNQAELEQLARRFQAAGHPVVGSLAEADLHVVNSCTVTHVAARDSRKVARRGHRWKPSMRTVLTGCYVTAEPEKTASLAGVDLVVPNQDKDQLLEHVQEAFPELALGPTHTPAIPVPYVPLEFGNSRALVKVEDGCNMRCSFCIIPLTRGRQRSRPVFEVIEEVRALAATGCQEVVITGVQISSYDWRGRDLYDLTRSILESTRVPRLRLTSIAPWQFDHRLLELFDSERLCRHVHLSLQSGCSATLSRMRRPYSSEDFARLVETLRNRVPGIAITTDVIVGFPGESDSEFEHSLRFTRDQEFARVHAFPFSPRPGTEAADLSGQIPVAVKRLRMERMLEVAQHSQERFAAQHSDSTAQVLWECCKQGMWYGMTDNYLRVVTASEVNLEHQITSVRLTHATEMGLIGALQAEPTEASTTP